MELVVPTVREGWPSVLSLYRGAVPRVVSRHGVAFDIAGLTVVVENPADLTMPEGFRYPELVKDFRDRLFGGLRDSSLFYQRLRHWPTGEGSVDQLTGVLEILTSDANSRAAVFSVWEPSEDLGSAYPVSPVGGAVRVIEEQLHLFVTARSLDVWISFVPEFLAFSQLAVELAQALGLATAKLSLNAWSAHLYEVDYLTYVAEATE